MNKDENKKVELTDKDLTEATGGSDSPPLYCMSCDKYFDNIIELRKHIVEGRCVRDTRGEGLV